MRPVRLKGQAIANIDSGPVNIDSGSVNIDSGSVNIDSGSVNINGGPVNIDDGPVNIDDDSVKVECSPSVIPGGDVESELSDRPACRTLQRASTID